MSSIISTTAPYILGGGGGITILLTIVRWLRSRERMCVVIQIDQWTFDLRFTRAYARGSDGQCSKGRPSPSGAG